MGDGRFKKLQISWNKGTKGLTIANSTSFKKGRIATNKKEHIKKSCPTCGNEFSVKPSLIRITYCSRSCALKGKPSRRKGFKASEETKLKQRLAKIGNSGKNHWNYRGYKNKDERDIAMSQDKYIQWRKSIFKRDGYTCQSCFFHGGYLEAHHIKAWKIFPELRYTLSNGITLCRKCHKQQHKKRA